MIFKKFSPHYKLFNKHFKVPVSFSIGKNINSWLFFLNTHLDVSLGWKNSGKKCYVSVCTGKDQTFLPLLNLCPIIVTLPLCWCIGSILQHYSGTKCRVLTQPRSLSQVSNLPLRRTIYTITNIVNVTQVSCILQHIYLI